jgi:SPP1 gp7 family putative phage head morphogenesis protein
MCEVAVHTEHSSTASMIINRDPTRTTTLRAIFVRDMDRRFNELKRVITQSIVVEDVFGLRDDVTITSLQMTTPGRRAFAFPTNTEKVSAFMDWINRQVGEGILDVRDITQVGKSINGAWTNKYIFDSYKRAVIRARTELKKAGFDIPTIAESGGIQAVMMAPIHLDRVGLLYTRAFNGLKGITDAMDTQISQVLSEGLIAGEGPRTIARRLVQTVSGKNRSLELVDSLGRTIGAQRRAEILARTETIRAHAQGTLQEYQNWGAVGVNVKAEFITAGDNRVCQQCSNLEGQTFLIKDAWNIIPVHAQCRCAWVPVPPEETATPKPWPEADINDPAKLSAMLKDKAHVAMNVDQLATAAARKNANIIGRTMANDVWGTLGNLSAIDADTRLAKIADAVYTQLVKNFRNLDEFAGKGVIAMFRPRTLDIALNTNKIKSFKNALQIGSKNWQIGADMASTYRHEYGHWLYELGGGRSLHTAGVGAKQEALRAWNKFYRGRYKWDNQTKKWINDTAWDAESGSRIFSEKVSHYAGTDANEAFAESFSAYTSPLYGIEGKRLPKQIEELLEDIIGKRTDL